jgi:hypothetical protein
MSALPFHQDTSKFAQAYGATKAALRFWARSMAAERRAGRQNKRGHFPILKTAILRPANGLLRIQWVPFLKQSISKNSMIGT